MEKEYHPFGEEEKFRDELVPASWTGFLIEKNILLTAAHCICERESNQLYPLSKIASMRIVFGFQMIDSKNYKKTFEKKDVYHIKRVIDHAWTRENSYFDWALLELDRDVVGRPPLKLNFSKKDDAKNLNHFFDLLDSPKDIIGLYSTLLKVRCLEECGWTDTLEKIKEYEKEARWWCSLVTNPILSWSIDRFVSEVFEISPASTKKVLSPILISLFREKKVYYGYRTDQTGLLADPKEILPLIKQCLENERGVTADGLTVDLGELFGRIGRIDIRYSLPLIEELLKNKRRIVRWNAVAALSQLGQTHLQLVLPLLLKTLEDEDEAIRYRAVEALAPFGKVEPKTVYPPLIRAFEGETKSVKSKIIHALSLAEQVEFRPSFSTLEEAVIDENDELRVAAIKSNRFRLCW